MWNNGRWERYIFSRKEKKKREHMKSRDFAYLEDFVNLLSKSFLFYKNRLLDNRLYNRSVVKTENKPGKKKPKRPPIRAKI